MHICGLKNASRIRNLQTGEESWSINEGSLGDDFVLTYDLIPGKYSFEYNCKPVDFNLQDIKSFVQKIEQISTRKIFYLDLLSLNLPTDPFQELLIFLDVAFIGAYEKRGKKNIACGSEIAKKIWYDLLTYYQVFMDDFKFRSNWSTDIYRTLIDVASEASQNGMMVFFHD